MLCHILNVELAKYKRTHFVNVKCMKMLTDVNLILQP